MQANDLEWLKENRGRRLTAWAFANLSGPYCLLAY